MDKLEGYIFANPLWCCLKLLPGHLLPFAVFALK